MFLLRGVSLNRLKFAEICLQPLVTGSTEQYPASPRQQSSDMGSNYLLGFKVRAVIAGASAADLNPPLPCNSIEKNLTENGRAQEGAFMHFALISVGHVSRARREPIDVASSRHQRFIVSADIIFL